MPRILPSVLSPADLPESELHAARLDGELFAVGECFGVVDEIASARLRGASLAAMLPERLIAEGRTAAWVHGVVDSLPLPLELCVDQSARYRCLGRRGMTVREVLLDDGDTEPIGGMTVTTVLRTALDLLRAASVFTESEILLVRALAAAGGFTGVDLIAQLHRRRHLPNKTRALARVAVTFELLGQPAFTRYTS